MSTNRTTTTNRPARRTARRGAADGHGELGMLLMVLVLAGLVLAAVGAMSAAWRASLPPSPVTPHGAASEQEQWRPGTEAQQDGDPTTDGAGEAPWSVAPDGELLPAGRHDQGPEWLRPEWDLITPSRCSA